MERMIVFAVLSINVSRKSRRSQDLGKRWKLYLKLDTKTCQVAYMGSR